MATSKTKTSTKKTTTKKVNYTFDSTKESASQYNTRIAKERGDTASQLSSMQDATKKAYSSSGLNPNKTTTVRATDINSTTSPTIPDKTVPTNDAGVFNPNLVVPGLTQDANGMYVADKTESDNVTAANKANATGANAFSQFMNYIKPTKDQYASQFEDTYGVTQKQVTKDMQAAQAEKVRYANELNAINKERDAAMLSLEGQGRGQTSGFIGGEQARINREAAIKALPIQASYEAAQGNYEVAKGYVDQLFQMKIADIQADNQYKQSVAGAWMQYATTAQQNLLNAALADNQQRNAERTQYLSMMNELSNAAIDYGQPTLAGKIMRLDPKSATFMQDYAALKGQVVKPVSVTSAKRDTQVVNEQLIDMQTGEIIASLGATPGGTLNGKPQTQAQSKIQGYADRLSDAEKILKESDKFASLMAFGGILPNALKTEDRQKFEQAQRNFVNAVLRTESGAVISDAEFANAQLQYFPAYGDSAGVLAQKAANRNTVINNFYREANVSRPVNPGDIIEANGARYKVAEDGETLIEI